MNHPWALPARTGSWAGLSGETYYDVDCVADDCDDEDGSDDEWELGWTDVQAVDADVEEQCEDEGSQCDDEGVINGDQESNGSW